MDIRYNIIKRIAETIKQREVLRDYESYEQFPVIQYYRHTECLKLFVNEKYSTAFLANMAIMYVNQCILYAKSQLTEEEFKDYIVLWGFWEFESHQSENGFAIPDVYFSRKKFGYFPNAKIVNIEDTPVYDYIKDIIGIKDFICYSWRDPDGESDSYDFVPKCFAHRIYIEK